MILAWDVSLGVCITGIGTLNYIQDYLFFGVQAFDQR